MKQNSSWRRKDIWILFALVGPLLGEEAPGARVVIYGASPGGLMAAVAAARMGESVDLIEPSNHVGGCVSGGLTVSDVARYATVGGMAREFFDRVRDHYAATYGPESVQVKDSRSGTHFEPHVAEMVFEKMLSEQARIKLYRRCRLESVRFKGSRVRAVVARVEGAGKAVTFEGEIFIDATYTGDLMAAAGVPYRVGREGRSEYGESYAGLNNGPKSLLGHGDHRVQAYNYRICLTNRPENRIPVPRPDKYDPTPFLGRLRAVGKPGMDRAADLLHFPQWKVPNDKIDANVADFPGANYAYAEGDAGTRRRIEEAQRNYSLSFLFFLQNDERFPEEFRAHAREWGLPKDEFKDNGHFPHQIYIRVARRMLGRYVLTQQDVTDARHKEDGICLGSFMLDSHQVQRFFAGNHWSGEGGIGEPTDPYEIPYRILTPFSPENLLVTVCVSATHVAYSTLRMEPVYMMMGHAAGMAAHLAIKHRTPVQKVDTQALRALLVKQGQLLAAPFRPRISFSWTPSHPAPGVPVKFQLEELEVRQPLAEIWWDFDGDGQVDSQSARPEFTFGLSKRYWVSVCATDTEGGRTRIVFNQVAVGKGKAEDVTMDNGEATYAGAWTRSNSTWPFYGRFYRHDQDRNKGRCRARFRPNLKAAGKYRVLVAYSAFPNRASNVPIEIGHRDGKAQVMLDQRKGNPVFGFVSLGEFTFKAGSEGYILFSNAGTDGHVIVDAARWAWLGE